MAVIASTLTTVAVFAPLVFVKGIAGQLFRDQALTVTFSLLASLLVAITLIPMLASFGGGRSPDDVQPPELRHPRNRFGRGLRWLRLLVFTRIPSWIARFVVWASIRIGRGVRVLPPAARGVLGCAGRDVVSEIRTGLGATLLMGLAVAAGRISIPIVIQRTIDHGLTTNADGSMYSGSSPASSSKTPR